MSNRYQIEHLVDIPPVKCPCGESRRAFTRDTSGVASMHLVEISLDAQTHYHKKLTELYYILEGEGTMELDGQSHPVKPGDAVLIKPGCRHKAIGHLKVLNVPVPAFDPDDEWFD